MVAERRFRLAARRGSVEVISSRAKSLRGELENSPQLRRASSGAGVTAVVEFIAKRLKQTGVMRGRSVMHDYTSGRCQMFISPQKGCQT